MRGEFLAYGGVLALLVLFRYRRQSALPLAALAAGAAIVVVPWTVRNMVAMDEVIVGTTGAGRVMYQGHNPDTDGGPSLIATGQLEAQFAGLPRKELELESNREGSRLAREWALDHPVEELQLVPKRLYRLFRSDESGVTWLQSNKPWLGTEGADRLIRLSSFAFFGLIAMSLASARLWWRPQDPRFWAVFGVVPFYMLIFGVLFIGDPRYHYAMYFPLAVFAAPGFAALWRLTADHWRSIAGERSLMSVLRTYGTPRAVNPLASHWLRLSVWLFVASPIVAFLVAITTGSSFRVALILTLYMWALVCVILAVVALGGLFVRLVNRGWRAIRR